MLGGTFNRSEAQVVGAGRRKHPQTPLHFVSFRLKVPPNTLFRQSLCAFARRGSEYALGQLAVQHEQAPGCAFHEQQLLHDRIDG